MAKAAVATWGSIATMVVALTGTHCDDSAPAPAQVPPTSVGQGGSVSDGGGAMGGGSGGEDPSPPTGDDAPVFLGVMANPPMIAGTTEGSSEVLLADLTAYAAGVRSMTLDVAFADLDADALSRIDDRVAAHVDRGLEVVLNVVITDGRRAFRPASTKDLAWDDAMTIDALRRQLDAMLELVGDEVRVVAFSRRADAYLEAHPNDTAAMGALLKAGISHVESRNAAIITGVGVDFLENPRPQATALAALGDTLVVAYFPGLGEVELPAPTPAQDLDAMLAWAESLAASDAPAAPIVLQAVGYPSAAELGASAEGQQQQLEAFFAALQSRRAGFSHITVHQLHDVDAEGCIALLADRGFDTSDPWGAYMCSTGLRDTAAEGKAAWTTFLQAAAALATP